MEWDFFISYASEDRESAANPMAAALTQREFNVWLDHWVLSDTTKLEDEIQRGLSHCHYGIVIVSRRFLEKDWPMRELDTLLAIETIDGRHRIVPVVHRLTEAALYEKVPEFIRKGPISTADGFDHVCNQVLERVLRAFGAPGILSCRNTNCSWRVPDDWPDFLKGAGPEFTLAHVDQEWCIVCAACGTPVRSVTLEEAKDIAAQVRVTGLWAPSPGTGRKVDIQI